MNLTLIKSTCTNIALFQYCIIGISPNRFVHPQVKTEYIKMSSIDNIPPYKNKSIRTPEFFRGHAILYYAVLNFNYKY